jgi:TolA-binding protein
MILQKELEQKLTDAKDDLSKLEGGIEKVDAKSQTFEKQRGKIKKDIKKITAQIGSLAGEEDEKESGGASAGDSGGSPAAGGAGGGSAASGGSGGASVAPSAGAR